MRAIKVRHVVSPDSTVVGIPHQFLENVAARARLVGRTVAAMGAGAQADAGKFQARFAKRHWRKRIMEFGGGIFRRDELCAQQDAARADGGFFEKLTAFDFHLFSFHNQTPASSRSVFNRNCPHAASMSWPFSRRSVAVTFCFSSAARNPSQTSSLGRCHGKSSTWL